MKTLKFSLLLWLLAGAGLAGKALAEEKSILINEGSPEVEVYYFHNTRRCETCLAIENETRNTIEAFYANQLKEGRIIFRALNLEEKANKEIIEKLKVAGQALLIVRNEKISDITDKGFLYARTNPEKLAQIIREKIGEF